MKKLFFTTLLLLGCTLLYAQKHYTLKSPDGRLSVNIEAGDSLSWSLSHDGTQVLRPSAIALTLGDGTTLGRGSHLRNARNRTADEVIASPFYKRAQIRDRYNELTLAFRERFSVVFRAYDEGVAYRFVTDFPKDFIVTNETARFDFGADNNAWIPYVRAKGVELEKQYFNSFENLYTQTKLSAMNPAKLTFTPLVVETAGGLKVCLAESDLEHYPGMYLWNPTQGTALTGNFAPYPKEQEQGAYNMLQKVVKSRENYIASCKGRQVFPWRIAIVATEDRQLADNDMVYKLAAPSRVSDFSWVKPGKVAWEWWNHWGLEGVDFSAGVNNKTYMAYIDFAARNGIEYVILDEGWSVRLKADLFEVVPEIDLEKLVAYAQSKNVGLILWAGYYAFDRDMERVCEHYGKMGIKGFKIDFMDRDDQQMVDFHYRAAETAARHRMLVDFHGTYKPTGINRTYPNVINFEGVYGLEQLKWNDIKYDQVTYDVTMPFIRMVAGPVDYTQGAMRNASRKNFRAINNNPMSQGTRCRQLAEYIVFESPLSMLCDSPTAYEREPECSAFISTVPTVWDETIALDGKIGEWVTTARRKGDVWYVGALTGWDARTAQIDLSFLGEGDFTAELYRDGVNADKHASDYKKERVTISTDRKISVPLAPGGGCVMRITKR